MQWQFTILFVVFVCPMVWADGEDSPGVDKYLRAKNRNMARAFLRGNSISDLGVFVRSAAKGRLPIVAK